MNSKSVKAMLILSAVLAGAPTVHASSHGSAPMIKDDAKKEMPAAASGDMTEGEIRKVEGTL